MERNKLSLPDGFSPTAKTAKVGRSFPDALPYLGFLYLTYNAIDALWRAEDYGTVAYVLFAYTDVLLLLWCFRQIERTTDRSSPKVGRLKAALWTFTTAAIICFSYRVTAIINSTVVSVVVWSMGAAFTASAFYGLFLMAPIRRPDVQPPKGCSDLGGTLSVPIDQDRA